MLEGKLSDNPKDSIACKNFTKANTKAPSTSEGSHCFWLLLILSGAAKDSSSKPADDFFATGDASDDCGSDSEPV